MPRKNAARAREQAARRAQMTMAIGQGLREAYGVPRSLPKRLLAAEKD
jgi:hypothetical protein